MKYWKEFCVSLLVSVCTFCCIRTFAFAKEVQPPMCFCELSMDSGMSVDYDEDFDEANLNIFNITCTSGFSSFCTFHIQVSIYEMICGNWVPIDAELWTCTDVDIDCGTFFGRKTYSFEGLANNGPGSYKVVWSVWEGACAGGNILPLGSQDQFVDIE